MSLKKKILDTQSISDWWVLHRCIQSLTICEASQVKTSKIEWIFVISGSFSYHGMHYRKEEYLSVGREETSHLILEQGSKYLVLTWQAFRNALNSSEDRKILEQK